MIPEAAIRTIMSALGIDFTQVKEQFEKVAKELPVMLQTIDAQQKEILDNQRRTLALLEKFDMVPSITKPELIEGKHHGQRQLVNGGVGAG